MQLPGRRVWELVVLEMVLGVGLVVFPASAIVQLHPVVLSVFHFPRVFESLRQEVTEIVVVWRVLEAEVANIGYVLCELLYAFTISIQTCLLIVVLTGITITQILDGGCLLLFSNLLVFLLVGRCFETLPRQAASQEVEKDMPQGFQIVSP